MLPVGVKVPVDCAASVDARQASPKRTTRTQLRLQETHFLFISPPSKQQLQLHPHAANAAVGVVAIHEMPRWRVENISWRRVHELWMIEGIQRFPAEFQPPRLSNGYRPGQV